MTGRTCPVHGEYSASGVCRWCEKPSGTDQSTITLPLLCICKTCLRGFEAPIPLTSLVCPECRAATVDDLRVAGYFEPSGINAKWGESPGVEALRVAKYLARHIALFPTSQEYRLAQQHAALRWERVARRWNYKHCEPRWINEEWRAYVWRCWLEQMALRREGNLIAAGIPKEWP